MYAMMSAMVLAQKHAGRVRGIRDSFGDTESGGGAGHAILLLLLGGLVLLVGYAWLRSRRAPKGPHNAFRLFEEALASLGASPEDRALLKRLVRDLRLDQPNQLLLNAGYFDRVVDKWVAGTTPQEQSRLAERFKRIRGQATLSMVVAGSKPA